MNKLLSTQILNFIYFLTIIKGIAAQFDYAWSFDFKDIQTQSSNKDLLEFRLKIERVSRGNFALSGEFYLNFDITADESNQIAVEVYRSANGDGDYKKLPYEIPRSPFYDVINTHYKSAVMNALHGCSDMPYFATEIPQPVEKKLFTLNKCKLSQEGLPSRLDSGTYKVVIKGYGAVEWEIALITEVEDN